MPYHPGHTSSSRRLGLVSIAGRAACGLALLICCLPGRAVAQGGFTIAGRVNLPDGRPAGRVTVKIEGMTGLNREARSDDSGNYEFRGIPSGRYRLTVNSPADPALYTDPVEADTTRTASNRLVVHIYLRRAADPKRASHKPGVVSVAEAAQKVPKEARKAFEQGLQYKRDRKHDRALASFDRAIELFPEYFQALTERGELRITAGKCADAFADFERALKLDEQYLPALRGAGYCRLEQQQFTEAAHYLVRALKVDADDANSHLFLGIALIGLNQSELAKAALQEALKLDETGAMTAHVYLADIYARNRQFKEAADELQLYLRARPTAPNAEKLKAREADFRARAKSQPE